MCRVPLCFLLSKARSLYHEYLITCTEEGVEAELVEVSLKWVHGWLHEHRLTHRMPNRKYKVNRHVLKERLCIWWLNIHLLRMWIFLVHGYDPVIRNVDQSPFHRNEAGSKQYGTIVERNSCKVPLHEHPRKNEPQYRC